MGITDKQRAAIVAKLATINLTTGKGQDEDHACTISAINIALGNGLTDKCDPCMSPVVHAWTTRVQDAMPGQMRAVGDEHGDRWRAVAPLIAGSTRTGPTDEQRVRILIDWLWDCLAHNWRTWVPAAAHNEWATMLTDRTNAAADAASYAASYAAAAAADAANAASYAAYDGVWRVYDPAAVLTRLVGSAV